MGEMSTRQPSKPKPLILRIAAAIRAHNEVPHRKPPTELFALGALTTGRGVVGIFLNNEDRATFHLCGKEMRAIGTANVGTTAVLAGVTCEFQGPDVSQWDEPDMPIVVDNNAICAAADEVGMLVDELEAAEARRGEMDREILDDSHLMNEIQMTLSGLGVPYKDGEASMTVPDRIKWLARHGAAGPFPAVVKISEAEPTISEVPTSRGVFAEIGKSPAFAAMVRDGIERSLNEPLHPFSAKNLLPRTVEADNPPGWLHAGQFVVFVKPPPDCDLGGLWRVIETDEHHTATGAIVSVRLAQGNSYMTAQPDQLAHVHQAGPNLSPEEFHAHRVIAVGGVIVKNAYGITSGAP